MESTSKVRSFNWQPRWCNELDFWGVPETIEEVRHMPAAVHTLKSSSLRHFSNKFMKRIIDEKEFNQALTRFADVLLSESYFEDEISMKDVPKDLLEGLTANAMVRLYPVYQQLIFF